MTELELLEKSARELADSASHLSTTAGALNESATNSEAYGQLNRHLKKKRRGIVQHIVAMMRRLTSEERKTIIKAFCTSCGDNDPSCQCWNDE